MAVIKMVIQLRRGTTAEWLANKDIVPAQGEPCYDYELNTLKIGNGVKTYEQLDPIGGAGTVSVAADGTSIVLEDGVFKLAGFDAATVGAQLRKSTEGKLEWYVPTVDVEKLQTDVTILQDELVGLKAIVGAPVAGSDTLLTRIETLEKEMDTFVTSMNDDDKVNTLMELIEYVNTHGEEAADMAADIKTLQDLVGSTPVNGQILAAIEASEKKAQSLYEHVKYEISHKPVGTLVDYRDKEIRVMVPADTKFEHQNSGTNADKNAYYIGFKAYAPEGAVNFKEDLAEIISDNTMYTFEGNDFAGIDEYGRKYSICWLAVAKYDEATQTWSTYGAKSSKDKYIGWYYSVEWYDANGVVIGSDCIRINLSNEACHNVVEPFYMSSVVKSVAVGSALLDVVDGKVNIPVGAGLKASEEITVSENGTLGIGKISFSKIVQDTDETVIMDGGSAAGK